MINFYDIAYALGVVASAPVWGLRQKSRTKVVRALTERMGHVPPLRGNGPAVLIHAVSLGEMNATRAMVDALGARRPDLRIVISTTTDTGYDRGRQLYPPAGPVRVVRYPLDFSTAIHRFLDRISPRVVVLMELEVWPNFLLRCRQRDIAVVLVNGRITPSAARRYRVLRPVTARMFGRLSSVCVQEPAYAKTFVELGAAADLTAVAGTMKFDTAKLADGVTGDDTLAHSVGIDRSGGPVWVCGSTGPGEEPLLLDVYTRLLVSFPRLRMVIVPRKPERFDAVAESITAAGFGLRRRSNKPGSNGPKPVVILGDTLGELRTFFSLATVVFVGRTLVDLGARQHGSDMIEPAALAKPVAVGPFTHNFAEPIRLFLAADAMRVVDSPNTLQHLLDDWLTHSTAAADLGRRAQQVVRNHRGATERHVNAILQVLESRAD